MSRLVGIDLGGTAIKAGALAADGTVLERRQVAAEVGRGARAVVERIAALGRELGARDGRGLGLGVPGLIDRARGVVGSSPNLKPMEGFPLRAELAAALGCAPERVRIENDANVAALGEHWIGGARGERNVLIVTLGTGVGGGLILNGELFAGEGGLGGEIGHVVIDPQGPPCGCGSRGCLETLASASAARRRARARGLTDDLEALTAQARSSDGEARALLLEVGRDLGRGLALALVLLDLRCFLFGGGFAAALDVLAPGIVAGILERSYGRPAESLRLLPAELGTDAGWIGAARLGLEAPPRCAI